MNDSRKKLQKMIAGFGVLCLLVLVGFSVTNAAGKWKITQKKLTLTVGSSKTLKIKNTKKKVNWYSSNHKVAVVSKKGKVKAISVGKAVITAKVQSKKFKCKVYVVAKQTEQQPAATASASPVASPTAAVTSAPTEKPVYVLEDGTYSTKEEVALYLHRFQKLPSNFITKQRAQDLGWTGGSIEPYAAGKCIGGDYFGNYEKQLPIEEGREYHECDIDTLGASSRGAKRLIYSNDGLIFYTEDHYSTFVQLY